MQPFADLRALGFREAQQRVLRAFGADQHAVEHRAFRIIQQPVRIRGTVEKQIVRQHRVLVPVVFQDQRATQAEAYLEAAPVAVGLDRCQTLRVADEIENGYVRDADLGQIEGPVVRQVAIAHSRVLDDHVTRISYQKRQGASHVASVRTTYGFPAGFQYELSLRLKQGVCVCEVRGSAG